MPRPNALSPLSLLLAIATSGGDETARAAATTACPFDPPRVGQIIPGLNRGGCYVCRDTETSVPLAGDELMDACRRMCLSHPDCKSFEAGRPEILPFLIGVGLEPINCCLEDDAVTEDHPLFVDGRMDSTNCGKQASCWASAVKSFDAEGDGCDVMVTPDPRCQRATMFEDGFDDERLPELVEELRTFLDDGCPLNGDEDGTLQSLLDLAANQCRAGPCQEDGIQEEDSAMTTNGGGGASAACPFEPPRWGHTIPGLNRGGCYECLDPQTSAPLTGNELIEACRQMCTTDCQSFEISRPDILPFYVSMGLSAINCCVEYEDISQDHALYVDGSKDATNCGKQSSCWAGVVKSADPTGASGQEACPTTARSPMCQRVEMPEDAYGDDEMSELTESLKGWQNDGCPVDTDDGDGTLPQSLLDLAGTQCKAKLTAADSSREKIGEDTSSTSSNGGGSGEGNQGISLPSVLDLKPSASGGTARFSAANFLTPGQLFVGIVVGLLGTL